MMMGREIFDGCLKFSEMGLAHEGSLGLQTDMVLLTGFTCPSDPNNLHTHKFHTASNGKKIFKFKAKPLSRILRLVAVIM